MFIGRKPEMDPMAGLSARERNQVKRKARQVSKTKSSTQLMTDVASSSAMKKRKSEQDVTDITPAPGVFSTGDDWPFEGFCEQLCFDLFSPQWEIRHGAAIGLREVIKAHGFGAGKLIGIDKAGNEERHQSWLEDVSIRLLCVLALDRFADFVGDQAVVPVRETCAMTLAVVMKYSVPKVCLQTVNEGILKLVFYSGASVTKHSAGTSRIWELRHAALIGLKYWMAVRTDLLSEILVFPGSDKETPAFSAIVQGYF